MRSGEALMSDWISVFCPRLRLTTRLVWWKWKKKATGQQTASSKFSSFSWISDQFVIRKKMRWWRLAADKNSVGLIATLLRCWSGWDLSFVWRRFRLSDIKSFSYSLMGLLLASSTHEWCEGLPLRFHFAFRRWSAQLNPNLTSQSAPNSDCLLEGRTL